MMLAIYVRDALKIILQSCILISYLSDNMELTLYSGVVKFNFLVYAIDGNCSQKISLII